MHQWVAVEDAPEMAQLLDAKMHSVEQIIEEEQAHRVQVAALSQMQLQAMERVEEQERELRRPSNLMAKHQAKLRTSPEGPQQQSSLTSPPHVLAQLRGEVEDVLPGTVNIVRGAEERAGQVPDLGNLPTLRGGGHARRHSSRTRTGGSPSHSPKVGQIFNIDSLCETCGVTQGDGSILQSVPGALC